MAKKKLPIELRVSNKVKNKIAQCLPLKDVSAYVVSAMRQFKHKRESILIQVNDINPLIAETSRILYEKVVKSASEKKALERKLQDDTNNEIKKAELDRIQKLNYQYQIAKSSGLEIRWGVALKPEDRKHFFNASEIKDIVAIRREKLSTYNVRVLLACSLAEINRWDEEGLLPHAFKQVIHVGGKANEARFWLESEVMTKKNEIEGWRKSYNLKKSFKRKKSPLVKVVG